MTDRTYQCVSCGRRTTTDRPDCLGACHWCGSRSLTPVREGLAYYNEIDPKAAAWLRELVKQGLIAPGDVDERSIVEVQASDVAGYTQCHFFAGIGGWSYALRLAGWPDDRPVWTGSCPCQPFSTAGLKRGEDDPRHLWPQFARLIRERRPPVVFGEQVASADGLRWLDSVLADLENADYAGGGRSISALRASARRTSASGSTGAPCLPAVSDPGEKALAGWYSPKAGDVKEGAEQPSRWNSPWGCGGVAVQSHLAGWPTPVTGSATFEGGRSQESHRLMLPGAALLSGCHEGNADGEDMYTAHMDHGDSRVYERPVALSGWPTARASDFKTGISPMDAAGAVRGDLVSVTQLSGWRTPAAHDGEGGGHGSEAWRSGEVSPSGLRPSRRVALSAGGGHPRQEARALPGGGRSSASRSRL